MRSCSFLVSAIILSARLYSSKSSAPSPQTPACVCGVTTKGTPISFGDSSKQRIRGAPEQSRYSELRRSRPGSWTMWNGRSVRTLSWLSVPLLGRIASCTTEAIGGATISVPPQWQFEPHCPLQPEPARTREIAPWNPKASLKQTAQLPSHHGQFSAYCRARWPRYTSMPPMMGRYAVATKPILGLAPGVFVGFTGVIIPLRRQKSGTQISTTGQGLRESPQKAPRP